MEGRRERAREKDREGEGDGKRQKDRVCGSGRFVKQEQRERWGLRAKWKLVSSPSTGGAKAVLRVGTVREVAAHCSGPGISPRKKIEILYAKSCNLVHFWPENEPFRSPVYRPLFGDPDKFTLSDIFCEDSQKISYSIRYFS